MREILLVASGGALGALGRYGVALLAARLVGPGLPWGTLVVNVLGSVLLGALTEAGMRAGWATPQVRLLLGTGVLGAFTTFSTFSVETVRLGEEVGWGAASLNAAANLVGALVGAAVGLAAVRAIAGPPV